MYREAALLAELIHRLEVSTKNDLSGPITEVKAERLAGAVSLTIPLLNAQVGRLLREIVPPGWHPCHSCALVLTDQPSRICPTCKRREEADRPKTEPRS